jgi:hypothetical protein
MSSTALHPWPWKTALLLFAISLFLLGRQLDFHGYVHDDEPNKVKQITEGKYNFNHPLLMLNSVRLYAGATGISADHDRVIRAGRWSSVVYSSLALALLVLVSGRLHGTFVAIAAGLFVLSTPLFFELAHYFKEDPSVLFGLALSLVAMQIYGEKPSAGRAAFLGLACGLAISGKYAGLVILPFAAYAILVTPRKGDLRIFALGALAVFALINWPMITSPEVWKSRVDLEVSRLQAENVPNRRQIPHGAYFAVFTKHASPVVIGLLAVYAFGIWRRKFRLSPAEWTLCVLPALFLLAISFIPTKSERYILPISVLFACVAAAGLAPLLHLRHGKLLAGLLVAASIAWQTPALYAEDRAFSSRTHDEVLGFLRENLPSSAVVLVDNYHTLAPPSSGLTTMKQRALAPHETLETLSRDGFTHVLVTSKHYPVFSPDSRKSSGLSPEDEARMRGLYDELFTRCRLIHEWKEGKKKMLEPEFRLYELPAGGR